MKRLFFVLLVNCFLLPFFSPSQMLSFSNEEISIQWNEEMLREGRDRSEPEIESPTLRVCGTPLMIKFRFQLENLTPEARKLAVSYLTRPVLNHSFDTPQGHFRIHYNTTGVRAVYQPSVDTDPPDGIPDYVNRCADIMDFIWSFEVDTLGYNSPPKDGNAGGNDKYDVYLDTMYHKYYGYAVPENWAPNPPRMTSYIVLRNDYSIYFPSDPLDLMRVTAAHEFFHAIQFGYDAGEFARDPTYPTDPKLYKPYWMEITAVWMEDIVYDDINDYLGYLYYFFRYPWLSLKTFSYNNLDEPKYFHAYASCVWAIYLSEKFGEDIIKDIWTKCGQVAGDNALLATSQVLSERGSSLNEAFQEFTIWNYFTSGRADTQTFYSEGNLFPYVAYHLRHIYYPVNVSSVLTPPENLGSNYVIFQVPPGATGGLNIGFYGDSLGSWETSLIGYKSGNNWFSQIDLDSMRNGTEDVYNWNLYNEIVMIPAVTTQQDNSFNYAYTASIDTALDVEEEKDESIVSLIRLFQNYPNPFNSSTTIPFTVHRSPLTENGPIPTTLTIYNILGQKIRTLLDEKKIAGTCEVSWDGKDKNGVEVASGIYFYQIKAGPYSEVKKMLLVK